MGSKTSSQQKEMWPEIYADSDYVMRTFSWGTTWSCMQTLGLEATTFEQHCWFFFFLIIISIIILISPYLYFVIGLLSDLYCGQIYAFLIVCFFCFWFGKRLNLDWEGCNPRPKKCLQCNCMSSRGRMLMQYHRRCVSVRWPWKKKYLLILKTGRNSYKY